MENNKWKTKAVCLESIKSRDFKRLKEHGLKAHPADWMFICAIKATKLGLGITIPKHAGNAVLRHKFKRWIKEYIRKQDNLPNAKLNIIFKRGKNYKELKYHEFERVIQRGLSQIAKKL